MSRAEIVLVRFPFVELPREKKRPALVLSRVSLSPRNALVTLAMVTSKTESFRIEGDVLLKDWKAAGLLHPSLVRLAKIATIDAALVDKQLGELEAADQAAVKRALRTLLRPWLA